MQVLVWKLVGGKKVRHSICRPMAGFPRGTECLAHRINKGRILVLEFADGTVVELDGMRTYLLATEYRVRLTGWRARLVLLSEVLERFERVLLTETLATARDLSTLTDYLTLSQDSDPE